MAYRRYGMGRTVVEDAACKAAFLGGFFMPSCWSALEPSPVAPPPAPTGEALTLPPASGAQAQALVDQLLNQQLQDQQALNAAGVQSSWVDRLSSTAVSAGESISAPGGMSWLLWGALALGVFALVAVSGGGPRRYGR